MLSSAAEVVKILRSSGGYVSGEEIALRLGISRAGVWKHIKTLRNMGFEVSAFTNRGYKLISVPDVPSSEVLSSILKTTVFGNSIEYHAVIDSTNDKAMELGRQGASSGTVVTADRQTAGKARNGGIWPSPSGKNLYLSILVRPGVELVRANEIALIALHSLASVVSGLFPDRSFVIQNSGIYSGDRKLGGILCEVQGEIGMIHHMVAGAGLNVSHHGHEDGTESLYSLSGKMLSRAELTASLLEEVERLFMKWKEE
jgi:BirA family biotin operon repressor/biotin-[acetyl-CoA-carboxylase] ligase